MPTLKSLLKGISQAKYVDYGYGQVEPNHLSAQRTGQIYAQLPAAPSINVLENGQFAKYDYAKGLVDFTTDDTGEWLLVFNEIKLYREDQWDCEFAMIKDNYQARYYSPYNGIEEDYQSRYWNGVDSEGKTAYTQNVVFTKKPGDEKLVINGRVYDIVDNAVTYHENTYTFNDQGKVTIPVDYAYDDVTAGPDMYELHYNEDPWHRVVKYEPLRMPENTTMVPRLFKTNVGDIYTTNMIDEEPKSLKVGDILKVRQADGILCKAGTSKMAWQVVKVYTMPDHQPGVKLMRVQ